MRHRRRPFGGRAPRTGNLPGLLRELPRAHLGLTVLLAGIVAVHVATAPVFALAAGAVIRSAEDGQTGLALVVLAAAFSLPAVLGPAGEACAEALGRRVTARMRRRTLEASLAPVGVYHVEDPAMLDAMARAEGSVLGRTPPGHAVIGLTRRYTLRLQGATSAVIVASIQPVLTLALIVALTYSRRVLGGLHRSLVEVVNQRAESMRRADYLRNLALEPGAAKEIRVFGLGGFLDGEYATCWLAVMEKAWRDRRAMRGAIAAAILPVLGTYAVILAYLAHRAARGEVSVADFVIVTQALFFTARLATVSHSDSLVAYGAAAIPAVSALEASISGQPRRSTASAPGRFPLGDGIRFEGVSFAYPGSTAEVLRRLDLDVPAGRSLALVGSNGAGKTTVIKLLARLYEPTGGRITAGGIDIAAADPGDWRRGLAVVFQDFVRYPLSAAENVGFGAVECLGDRALLERAARRAGAIDLIEGLSGGWDTILSRQYRGGAELSGGQWQRIALARALVARESGAGLLILDEPTAQLDVRAEASFYDGFLDITRGVTTIIVSHRFSTVRRADRIAVLADGQIAESGTHVELVERGGLYAELFEAQAQLFASQEVADV